MRLATCAHVGRFEARDATPQRQIMRRRDPTGTAPIRRAFMAEFDRRFQSLKLATRTVLIDQNMMGLARVVPGSQQVVHIGVSPVVKLDSFARWFDNSVDQIVTGLDQEWARQYTRAGYAKGVRHAMGYLHAEYGTPPTAEDSLNGLQSLTAVEMRGIAAELKRQSARMMARAIVVQANARDAFRLIADRIEKIGRTRSRALVDTAVVASHARGSLDTYALAGVTHVGIDPEFVPVKRTKDEAPAAPIKEIKTSARSPWLEPYRQAARRRAGLGLTVGVLTAGDDDVCEDCEALEENSPYSLAEASTLIPFHPHCRCALVPWNDEVEELLEEGDSTLDFDPDQPRAPAGSPEGGQWIGGSGGGGGSGGTERIREAGSGSAAQPPRTYARGGGGHVGGAFGSVTAVYEPTPETRTSLEAHQVTPLTWHEARGQQAAETFHKLITDAKASTKFGASVTVYDIGDYAKSDVRLFATPDGKQGFALRGTDIISVFRNTSSEAKDVTASVLSLAVQEGGRRLDCFDTVLPSLYAANGFRAVARTPFNPEYKPDGWREADYAKFNGGRPDVVFMVYDPPHAGAYKRTDGKLVDEYDKGIEEQHKALAAIKSEKRAAGPSIYTNMSRDVSGTRQPVSSIEELYERSREEEGGFKAEIEQFAADTRGYVTYTPPSAAEPGTTLKSKSSALRKMNTELDGDPTRLTDILRATIVHNTVQDAREAASKIIGELGDRIVTVKDRVVEATAGYRDIMLKYHTPGGLIAEVQFLTAAMKVAKFGSGHALYERMRVLDPKTTPPSVFMQLKAESEALYETAYKKDGNGNWGKAR